MVFRRIGRGLLKLYKRWVSPHLPPSCIYTPTCSEYASESVERFGMIRGSFLGLLRLLRCNLFFKGGLDQPPPVFNVRKILALYREFWKWGRKKGQ